MNDRQLSSFEAWLDTVRGLNARTIRIRISNCKRVEQFEGDLDSLFDNDRLASLVERLTYSTEDATYRRRPKHKVPINGDVRTGTATLKTAVTLYRDFRNSSEFGLDDRPRARPVRQRAGGRRTESESWPDWGQPTDETLRGLAQALTPLVRFLKPEIVAAIAEDTRRYAKEWSLRSPPNRRSQKHRARPGTATARASSLGVSPNTSRPCATLRRCCERPRSGCRD